MSSESCGHRFRILSFAFLTGCGALLLGAPEDAVLTPKCALEMHRDRYLVGQLVKATISITNDTPHAMHVIRPLLDSQRGAKLVAMDESGGTARYIGPKRRGFRPPPVSLAPGESLREEVVVSDYYDVGRPGSYTVRVFCRVRRAMDEDGPDSRLFSSDLTRFVVSEPTGSFQKDLSASLLHPDGSDKGKVYWSVFSDEWNDATSLYAWRFMPVVVGIGDRQRSWRSTRLFVDLGSIRGEENVACFSDADGGLSVLYQPAGRAPDSYTHALIPWSMGRDVHVQKTLYRAVEGRRPELTPTGSVRHAVKEGVEPDPAQPADK